MKMSKFKSALLILVILVLVSIAQIPVAYAIPGDQYVNVIMAWDEEMTHYAWCCGWDPYFMVKFNVDLASDVLYDEFGICFHIIGSTTWDSDDSITNIDDRFDEAVFDTGYSYGFTENSPLLIAVTNQPLGDFYGTMEPRKWMPQYGAMIIKFTPYCTDNIILHEISHFYECDDHWGWTTADVRDCVMQGRGLHLGDPPLALVNHEWCAECTEHINTNKRKFGFMVEAAGPGFLVDPCPTLFAWNGNDYVDYGVIDIHNPTGEDVVREVSVLAEDVNINNHKATFQLREGWEGLNRSESVIDQVKLYAVDNDGNSYLCPLISAEHSRLEKVLPQLLLSDDVRTQILLLETIDLEFIVPHQNIQGFTFIIEGCNLYK